MSLLISQIKIGTLSEDFNSEIPAGHNWVTLLQVFRETSSKPDKHGVNTTDFPTGQKWLE